MAHSLESNRLDDILATLEHDYREVRLFPEDVVTAASAATRRALRTARPGAGLKRRASAYFGAVVRRTALRRHPSSAAAVRIVVEAVVQDLTASGRGPRAVWEEIERGWADSVPHEVLEEYRLRLCA